MLQMLYLLALAATPISLDELVAAVGARPDERVAFREERHGELFAEPLVSTGWLEYVSATGELLKVVEHPEPATMRVTEKAIFVEREGRTRRIALGNRPELAGMFDGMRGLMEGRADVITTRFDPVIEPRGDGWRLILLPRGERLSRRLDRLVIDGIDDRVIGICTDLDDGEWHYLEFVDPPAATPEG